MRREFRKWLTARTTDVGLALAPRLSPGLIDRLGRLIGRAGNHLPVVARNVANNMRALGVYSSDKHRAYFKHVGEHYAGALHALRCAKRGEQGTKELIEIAARHVILDSSATALREKLEGESGVILVGPHISGYLLGLARLNQAVPLTVYLRYSKDQRRRAAKERWYQASGVDWISEPADLGGSMGRLGHMASALRAGRALFITPDLPRKVDDGTPVRLFDREIHLPGGAALLAERTKAPVYMLTADTDGAMQRWSIRGPFEAERGARGRAARRAAVQDCMQWFAAGFEDFLRTAPEFWFLWGDKRWTRVFAGDARYSRATSAEPVGDAAMDAARGGV